MNKHRPAAGINKPRYGDAATMSSQTISTLSATNLIDIGAPVKLRAAFTKAQDWSISEIAEIAEIERHASCPLVNAELLHRATIFFMDSNCQRMRRKTHYQVFHSHSCFLQLSSELGARCCPRLLHQRAVI